MRIVAALGGNALLRRRETPSAEAQRRNVETAVDSIAALAAEHDVVVAHGNGPQVVVDPGDPAFEHPSKPIGPVYTREQATRRVVPSPEPLAIVELRAIRLLVEHGVLVICVGGGGIPVVTDDDGALRGVEAVIDKDLAASLLASVLDVDVLLMLTDVPFVERGWRTPTTEPTRVTTPAELRKLQFAAGSMSPKAEAASRFVEATGRRAAIGALGDAAAIVRGDAGTTVRAGS
jgi:carbamate kinase